MENRLWLPDSKKLYDQQLVPELKNKFGRDNLLSLPRLEKIVINMGVGSAVQ